jgi:hypothetical protein
MKFFRKDLEAGLPKKPALPKKATGVKDKSPEASGKTALPSPAAGAEIIAPPTAVPVDAAENSKVTIAGSAAPAQSPVTNQKAPAAAKKRRRKPKPAALRKEWTLDVNMTLKRHDQILATAASLGLSASDYLLTCEEQAVHQLAGSVIDFIETKCRLATENPQKNDATIEGLLREILNRLPSRT